MTPVAVSVIVVSRHRPAALLRCLQSLTQQDHPAFEVIVVADPAAIQQVVGLALPIKRVAFDEANISAARNAGLRVAGAPVVAFIDDDAVAEPSWLSRLVAPFQDETVVAATGFVRGRNGISYQWQAGEVDALAQDHPFEVTGTTLRRGSPQRCVKTQGTNCAFHRASLLAIGGFDPAYRFYLDEADVNLRMAHLGPTAIVPGAEVHHGYEASARRRADRVPLSLVEIAASTAIFLRRHAPEADMQAALARLMLREEARIGRYLRDGKLTATAAADLRAGLQQGWQQGCGLPLRDAAPLDPALDPGAVAFSPLPQTGPRPGKVLAGRFWQKRRLKAEAASLANSHIVTVICLSPTARPHRMIYDPQGFWLQTGGLFGRSLRTGPRVKFFTFRDRIALECRRLVDYRPISALC